MSKLTQLFKSPNGGFPKILYIIPVLLIVVGGMAFLSFNIKKGAVKQKIQAASMAVGLQDDINFIATKTKASEVFALSKKEMIKAEKTKIFYSLKLSANWINRFSPNQWAQMTTSLVVLMVTSPLPY
ncbi:MAG: hypothetical protein AAF960_28750 [Bacteroidota bacterium]